MLHITLFENDEECWICKDDTNEKVIHTGCKCNTVVHIGCAACWYRYKRQDCGYKCEVCLEYIAPHVAQTILHVCVLHSYEENKYDCAIDFMQWYNFDSRLHTFIYGILEGEHNEVKRFKIQESMVKLTDFERQGITFYKRCFYSALSALVVLTALMIFVFVYRQVKRVNP
jgi:hypothetical protein